VDPAQISAELRVDDVMQLWPTTMRALLRRRMACVGCHVAPFHTVQDVARAYHVPVEMLLRELRESAAEAAR